jgi:predicted Rossmann-fold nucleotide-binding protein
LEELYEVWTWRQLGYHRKPMGLLNVAGYYDDLLRFMHHSVHQGFLSAPQHELLHVGHDAEALLLRLANKRDTAEPGDYSKV